MSDLKQAHDENTWKVELRADIITAMLSTVNKRTNAYERIGCYYKNYAPASLYKYYRGSECHLDAIRNNQMWYSAPCKFNDVFDCDVSVNQRELESTLSRALTNGKPIKAGSDMWSKIRQRVRQAVPSLRDYIDELRRTMGVACLCEADNSLLMWAHYANNHQGLCAEYNLLKINEQLSFTPIPVIYSNDRAKLCVTNPTTVEEDSLKTLIESITSKSPEWSYEREWRIVRDNRACGDAWNKSEKGALLEMVTPSSIILGCEVDAIVEQEMKRYCEQNEIDLYKMEKDELLYRLNKKPILKFNSSK